MSDPRLEAIRAVIQEDPGNRGLRTDPADNLITRTTGDFQAACRSIAETSQPSIAVVTGFWIAAANPPCAETDGPLGAVFLARALVPLGVHVTLLTDEYCRKALEEGLVVCGFGPRPIDPLRVTLAPAETWEGPRLVVPVLTIPDAARVEPDWPLLVSRLGLTHLIALERVGPSRLDGRCYSMRGRDITDHTAPAHHLFEMATQMRIPTVGIGDGGNEIGMGKLPAEIIARNIRSGDRIACRVATDHLIVAGVSNWGAYGLAAGVRLFRGVPNDPDLFDPTREESLLRHMVENGPLVDGVTARREATVDGLDFDRYSQALTRIGAIVKG